MLRILDTFFCGGGLRSLVATSLRLVETYFTVGLDAESKVSSLCPSNTRCFEVVPLMNDPFPY